MLNLSQQPGVASSNVRDSIEFESRNYGESTADPPDEVDMDKQRDSIIEYGQLHRYLYNQLATHLPDAVVYANHHKQLPYQITTQNVLMFLDISGFTALCENFRQSKNGADILTKILNSYMFALVNEIICSDGDILKFAGDAILTSWKVDNFRNMKITVAHVITCALNIQTKYGKWKAAVGIDLRVKIGISAGEVNTAYLGNEEYCHNVTLGRAVESVNLAERFCMSGDTVISPSAWCHCSGLPLEYEVLSDHKHMKITSIGKNNLVSEYKMVRTVSRTNSIVEPEMNRDNVLDGRIPTGGMRKRLSFGADFIPEAITEDPSLLEDGGPEVVMRRIRRAILENDAFVNKKLRLYVAPQVLSKLDLQQPLEYLSEMRQVTIVFINLQLQKVTQYELCRTLQTCFNIIYDSVKRMLGNLNKMFMFDKGCTFLAVFGLPGFKHENDCAHALRCSHYMKKELSEIIEVAQCSIGVTTGSTFCGVVGHDHRHEYTVIGRKVNMAARLMMHYPEKITCDNETFHHSNIHKTNFQTLELKAMKGLQNVGTIREFTENRGMEGTIEALKLQEKEHPLIGRDAELKRIMGVLHHVSEPSEEPHGEEEEEEGEEERERDYHILVLQGEPGVGKTRMLDSTIVTATNEHFKVIFCVLCVQDISSPFFTVKYLLSEALGFSIEMSSQQREDIILDLFKDDPKLLQHSSIFNEWLHLKLDSETTYLNWTDADLTKLFHRMIYGMIDKLALKYGKLLFALDNAHFVDGPSWEFIADFGRHPLGVVAVTTRVSSKQHQLYAVGRLALAHPSACVINLEGLADEYMADIGCQILGVVKLPARIESLLRQKSRGIPAWCEQLLQSMCQEGTLKLIPYKDEMPRELDRSATPTTQVYDPEGIQKRMSGQYNPLFPAKMVAVIAEDASLDVKIPNSLRGLIQARIDQLHHTDQLVVKTAAVLGRQFPADMLEATLQTHLSKLRLYHSLRRLTRAGILHCDSLDERCQAAEGDGGGGGGGSALTADGDRSDRVLTVRLEDTVHFIAPDIQETAYEMFLESARRQLHVRAALFLESLSHPCAVCGGDAFVSRRPTIASQPDAVSSDLSIADTTQGSVAAKTKTGSLFGGQAKKCAPKYLVLSTAGDSRWRLRSSIDAPECTCQQMLKDIYPQLVRHWKLAGNISKMVNILMEAAAAAIDTEDCNKALEYLEELREILDAVKRGKNPFPGEVSHPDLYEFDQWLEARCESLLGQALWALDRTTESLLHFKKALHILGLPQSSAWWKVAHSINKERFRQFCHQTCPSRAPSSVRDVSRLVEQALCLSYIFRYHLQERHHKLALMTVLQQLNKAEDGFVNFQQLITAYTCMMECCHVRRWDRKGQYYEKQALHWCKEMVANSKSSELVAVMHFYEVSMKMHLTWCAINKAINSGYAAKAVLDILHNNDRLIQVLPMLTTAIVLTGRVVEAVEIMEELEYTTLEHADIFGKTWYYVCCMDLILVTGYQLEHADKCIEFTAQMHLKNALQANTLPFFCITSCIALWCIRKGDYGEGRRWLKLTEGYSSKENVCFMAATGYARILECKLIVLSRASHGAARVVFQHEALIVKKDIRKFRSMTKLQPSLRPRQMVLEAYYLMLRRHSRRCRWRLTRCIALCKRCDNAADGFWAEHQREMWFYTRKDLFPTSTWVRYALNGSMVNCQLARQQEFTPLQYTLPLPEEL